MNDPDVGADLNRIDDAVGAASVIQHELDNAGAQALERLSDIWFTAFRDDRQGAQRLILNRPREALELFQGPLNPGDRPRTCHKAMLSYLTTNVKA